MNQDNSVDVMDVVSIISYILENNRRILLDYSEESEISENEESEYYITSTTTSNFTSTSTLTSTSSSTSSSLEICLYF